MEPDVRSFGLNNEADTSMACAGVSPADNITENKLWTTPMGNTTIDTL